VSPRFEDPKSVAETEGGVSPRLFVFPGQGPSPKTTAAQGSQLIGTWPGSTRTRHAGTAAPYLNDGCLFMRSGIAHNVRDNDRIAVRNAILIRCAPKRRRATTRRRLRGSFRTGSPRSGRTCLGDAHTKAIAPHARSAGEVRGHIAGDLDNDRSVLILLAEHVSAAVRCAGGDRSSRGTAGMTAPLQQSRARMIYDGLRKPQALLHFDICTPVDSRLSSSRDWGRSIRQCTSLQHELRWCHGSASSVVR